jgi:putative ABC transport system permease protein
LNRRTLIVQGARFYWRTHLGVVLATAVAAAVLVGALVLGDCVRYTLRRLALVRLGDVHWAIGGQDRFFDASLADRLAKKHGASVAPVLVLRGSGANPSTDLRSGNVQVLGVDERFGVLGAAPDAPNPGPGEVVLNEPLARRLDASKGDRIILRVERPEALSRDAPLTPADDVTAALSLVVAGVASEEQFGRFGLQANQVAPLNAFVSLAELGRRIQREGRANLLLATSVEDARIQAAVRDAWRLDDAELELRARGEGASELRTGRIFLDASVGVASGACDSAATGVLTYLVNEIRMGQASTPYSMVTALGPLGAGPAHPLTEGLLDDEIVLNQWLADDLNAKVGEKIELRYFVVAPGRALVERSQRFRVRRIVPIEGLAADPSLMPDFPGLSNSENCRDWDPSLPVELDRIRDKDEAYWDDHRGTPKAFVTLDAGREMWGNRFGDLTAVRFASDPREMTPRLRAALDPATLGLGVIPVREQALAAGAQSLDLGQYFLGLSFFLIVAALLLVALLFAFGVDQRSGEIGTLLATGFTPSGVRRLLLGEGAVLAVLGALVGVGGGILYARAMLLGLGTLWRGVSTGSEIRYHAGAASLVVGAGAATLSALVAMWIALHRRTRLPARELLSGTHGIQTGSAGRHRLLGVAIATASLVAGIVLIVQAPSGGRDRGAAGVFFPAGALVLLGGLAICYVLLTGLGARRGGKRPSMIALSLRNAARRPWRSLVLAALLAAGSFLVVSISVFHLDAPSDVLRRGSGTGGFALMASCAVPIFVDLNSSKGRRDFALDSPDLADLRFVPLRVREGDDASCLNLNRAVRPTLLGVSPAMLMQRRAFGFVEAWNDLPADWTVLARVAASEDEVWAIADEPTLAWGLAKRLGDTLDYVDEAGRPFKVRIVAALRGSVLQGSLLISEEAFVKRFPSSGGYRRLLIDAPQTGLADTRRRLSRALADVGGEVTLTSQRLAELNVVQNTYLAIFQALGLLGMLLGSVGLGVVVVRNALERRGELALLRAVGFSRRRVGGLVFLEHGGVLALGLACGAAAAVAAVWPALGEGTGASATTTAAALGAILINGLLWTLAGTALAVRGRLITALRSE